MMIEVKEDQIYVIGSQDKNFIYNHIYSDDTKYRTHKVSILIKNEDGTVIDSAILSFEGFSQIGESSYIVVKNEIFILAGKYLACLDFDGLEFKWKVEADESCCFKLLYSHNKLIVHGELCISCFDLFGNKIWEYYGRDIFANVNDKNSCEIKDDKIYLIDFENNEYVLDFDGETLQ